LDVRERGGCWINRALSKETDQVKKRGSRGGEGKRVLIDYLARRNKYESAGMA